MQVSDTLTQSPVMDVPERQVFSCLQVSVPLKFNGQGRCSVRAEGVQVGAGGWYARQ